MITINKKISTKSQDQNPPQFNSWYDHQDPKNIAIRPKIYKECLDLKKGYQLNHGSE